MNHTEFFKVLKNGEVSPVYLFSGSETYVMKNALKQLEDAVIDENLRSVNLTELEGNATGETICSACETVPFLSEKRMTVVSESGFVSSSAKPDGEDRLCEYISSPSDTAVLVFLCAQPDKRKKVYKELLKNAINVEFNKLTEYELSKWIEKVLKTDGITIEPATVQFLTEYADPRPEALVGELEKLICYKKSGCVSIQDIKTVVTPCTEYSVFKMTDAMTSRNVSEALALLSGMLKNREEPLYLLGAISKQYRKLLRFKIMQNEKKSKKEILDSLGMRDFAFARTEASVKNLSEAQLKTAVDLCFETDIGLKTGDAFDEVALHTLTVKLCQL